MTDVLKKLIINAEYYSPSSGEQEEQRRGFAQGNAGMANVFITKGVVETAAENLDRK